MSHTWHAAVPSAPLAVVTSVRPVALQLDRGGPLFWPRAKLD
jgi:hypothetical protein